MALIPPHKFSVAMLLLLIDHKKKRRKDVYVSSNGIMFITSFVKIGELVQRLKWRQHKTHTEHNDLKGLSL